MTTGGRPWPGRWGPGCRWAAASGAVGEVGDDDRRANLRYRWALRVALGLDVQAGDPEVRAHLPAETDTLAVRALAILCLDVYERFEAGETVPQVAVNITPFATTPAWRIPRDQEPVDRRIDQLVPGDLVAGYWDSSRDRRLITAVSGPVTAAPTGQDRREHGTWVTVGIDGTEHEHRSHVWFSVYPERP